MPGDQINYETQQPTGEVTETTIKCFSTNWKNKDTPPPPTQAC